MDVIPYPPYLYPSLPTPYPYPYLYPYPPPPPPLPSFPLRSLYDSAARRGSRILVCVFHWPQNAPFIIWLVLC